MHYSEVLFCFASIDNNLATFVFDSNSSIWVAGFGELCIVEYCFSSPIG